MVVNLDSEERFTPIPVKFDMIAESLLSAVLCLVRLWWTTLYSRSGL